MSSGGIWFARGVDQDWVDSVNGFWSVLLLAICSVGSFLIRSVSDPISCFTPENFDHPQSAYAKSTCFNQDVFHISQNASVTDGEDMEVIASYHLWVPVILFVQAMCFKLPNIFWNLFKPSVTFNLEATVSSLEYAQVTNAETKQTLIRRASIVMGNLLQKNRLTVGMLYLFVKLLYCFNLFGQFIFLTLFFRQFLAMKASDYVGFDITSHLQPLLQREFQCNFFIRHFQNIIEYSLHCELTVVYIYEMLFVFLWYWVFLLAIVTFINLLLWAAYLFLPFLRDSRISVYIKTSPGHPPDSSDITPFISGFLGINGVLMLSMISLNSSGKMAADLSQQLYQVFLDKGNQTPAPGISVNTPAAKVVAPEEGTALEDLSSAVADASSTNLLDEEERVDGCSA